MIRVERDNRMQSLWSGREDEHAGTSERERADLPLTLVLGGTGKTGRRVAERLAARGLPARIGSRSGEPPFDWENEATWGRRSAA